MNTFSGIKSSIIDTRLYKWNSILVERHLNIETAAICCNLTRLNTGSYQYHKGYSALRPYLILHWMFCHWPSLYRVYIPNWINPQAVLGCPSCVWCRGLATWPFMLVHLFAILFYTKIVLLVWYGGNIFLYIWHLLIYILLPNYLLFFISNSFWASTSKCHYSFILWLQGRFT